MTTEKKESKPLPPLPSAVEEVFPGSQYEEVTGEVADLFFFQALGDSIHGRYQGTRKVEGEYGPQHVYDIRARSDQRLYTIYGNADLNAKMAKVRAGADVAIEYIGDEPMRTGYSPRRIFSVKVAKGSGNGSPPPPPTAGPRRL